MFSTDLIRVEAAHNKAEYEGLRMMRASKVLVASSFSSPSHALRMWGLASRIGEVL